MTLMQVVGVVYILCKLRLADVARPLPSRSMKQLVVDLGSLICERGRKTMFSCANIGGQIFDDMSPLTDIRESYLLRAIWKTERAIVAGRL